MADETNNDTMSAILSEMEGFKCRNLETGKLEKCYPISGYLRNRIKKVYERDIKELLDSVRDASQSMCAHCQFRPCEGVPIGEKVVPCSVVLEARALLEKYAKREDKKPNEDDGQPF